MPDHVHLLIRRACDSAEQMVEAFQEITRTALIDAGKRSPTHPTWTKGPGWKGFHEYATGFCQTIKYIRENPLEIGLPEQNWDFVSEYDGWLPVFV